MLGSHGTTNSEKATFTIDIDKHNQNLVEIKPEDQNVNQRYLLLYSYELTQMICEIPSIILWNAQRIKMIVKCYFCFLFCLLLSVSVVNRSQDLKRSLTQHNFIIFHKSNETLLEKNLQKGENLRKPTAQHKKNSLKIILTHKANTRTYNGVQ